MKKSFLILAVLCFLGLVSACKNRTITETSTTNEITWITIENKLHDKIPLNENDCLFILTDTTLTEDHSEGIGNYLFNLLCGNRKANKLFSNARKEISKEEGDKNMTRLMSLMSIDIVFNEYTQYEEFLNDFPMFQGCAGAEELFNEIMANGI